MRFEGAVGDARDALYWFEMSDNMLEYLLSSVEVGGRDVERLQTSRKSVYFSEFPARPFERDDFSDSLEADSSTP